MPTNCAVEAKEPNIIEALNTMTYPLIEPDPKTKSGSTLLVECFRRHCQVDPRRLDSDLDLVEVVGLEASFDL